MIMTDEELEKRLNSPDNLCKIIEKKNLRMGRPTGATQLPDSIKDLINITSNSSSETQEQTAETFGIDQSTVSKTARGLVGNRHEPRLSGYARSAKEDREQTAHEAALDSLMTTLHQLQPKLVDPEL